MGKFYEDLKEGFEEIVAYRKGKITLRSEKIVILEPPKASRGGEFMKKHKVKYTDEPIGKIKVAKTRRRKGIKFMEFLCAFVAIFLPITFACMDKQ